MFKVEFYNIAANVWTETRELSEYGLSGVIAGLDENTRIQIKRVPDYTAKARELPYEMRLAIYLMVDTKIAAIKLLRGSNIRKEGGSVYSWLEAKRMCESIWDGSRPQPFV